MIRDNAIATILGALALALVLGALGMQYLAHLAPCEMCHWQRWPHIAAAVIGIAGTRLWARHRHLWIAATLVVVGITGLFIADQSFNLPYGIAAIVVAAAGLALTPEEHAIPVAVIVLVALSGLIGAYQTGMQTGLFPGPSACTVAHAYVLGSGAPPPQASCNAVTWSLFGLSLAAYNAIIALSAAIFGAIFMMKRK